MNLWVVLISKTPYPSSAPFQDDGIVDPKDIDQLIGRLERACKDAADNSNVFRAGGITVSPSGPLSLFTLPRVEGVYREPSLLCGQ